MEAQKKQVAELASQVTIPDEWRDTKASLIEEKLSAFNLESKLRGSSGFGAVFRDVRLASTGRPTIGQEHYAACINQAELYFHARLGLQKPVSSSQVDYPSVIERLFF